MRPASASPNPSAGGAEHHTDAAWQLGRLLDGYLVTQLLFVASELGIPNELAGGPRTARDLAAAVGADADVLTRILRGLVAEGVLADSSDGRFTLTPLGEELRRLQGAAVVRGELYYHVAEKLRDAALGRGVPFELSTGAPFFEYLSRNADLEAAFQRSMTGRAQQEARDVVDAYDFSTFARVVDVGGGRGVLIAEILTATPGLTAVLVDRAPVVAEAQSELDAAGLRARVTCVAHDIFESVPEGADVYLLSRVLHDWDDGDAVRILRVCHAAMPAHARLLVVDAIVPDDPHASPAAVRMDLHMLLLLGSRERTEAELRGVLASAGFRHLSTTPTRSPAGLAVVEAVPR